MYVTDAAVEQIRKRAERARDGWATVVLMLCDEIKRSHGAHKARADEANDLRNDNIMLIGTLEQAYQMPNDPQVRALVKDLLVEHDMIVEGEEDDG